MKILAIGAHFDDIELGCGGTIARHTSRGDEVHFFVATHSGYENEAGELVRSRGAAVEEGTCAAKLLGAASVTCGGFETNRLQASDELVCALLKQIKKHRVDLVYTHWLHDVHLDHEALARATLSATRHVPRVLMYRANVYPAGASFPGRHFVDISETVELKRQAIMAHLTEWRRAGDGWLRMVLAQNQIDGATVGVNYAERFEAIKYLC